MLRDLKVSIITKRFVSILVLSYLPVFALSFASILDCLLYLILLLFYNITVIFLLQFPDLG